MYDSSFAAKILLLVNFTMFLRGRAWYCLMVTRIGTFKEVLRLVAVAKRGWQEAKMINARMEYLGSAPSAIRELFQYGLERKAAIGAENVFDFSLGNPNVPVPQQVRDTLAELACVSQTDAAAASALHSYTPGPGALAVREAIAESVNRRFAAEIATLASHAVPAHARDFYLTVGAAPALLLSLAAVTNPGDEVIVIAPYFPEYKVWIEQVGATCVEVPAHAHTFQPDVPAIAAAITPRTAALIVNSPNNPTGAVYTRSALTALAAALEERSAAFARPLYLITDEPYRELTYGAEVPYIPALYARTIVGYSYSKSFSLAGERIGYVFVPEAFPEAPAVQAAVAGAGRAYGYVCAPSIWQEVIRRCVDVAPDVAPYARNREALTAILDRCGYTYVQPDGAFYLWMRALEPDARAFCERAKAHELLIVPSDSFGVGGWVRISYCVAHDTIVRSEPAFAALAKEYRAQA